jgi:hypothetical protein
LEVVEQSSGIPSVVVGKGANSVFSTITSAGWWSWNRIYSNQTGGSGGGGGYKVH